MNQAQSALANPVPQTSEEWVKREAERDARMRADQLLRLRFDTFATILSQRHNLSPEQAADAAQVVYKKLMESA